VISLRSISRYSKTVGKGIEAVLNPIKKYVGVDKLKEGYQP